MSTPTRPRSVTVIVVVNGIAAVITFAFWVLVLLRLFGPASIRIPLDRPAFASTLGFLLADLAIAVPALAASVPGLWHMRLWGWMLAQVANALWVYTLIAIWTRDLVLGTVSPGSVLFLPFAVFAIWAFAYLWQQRRQFCKRRYRA